MSLARRRAPLGAHGRLLEHNNQFCRFQRNRCIELANLRSEVRKSTTKVLVYTLLAVDLGANKNLGG